MSLLTFPYFFAGNERDAASKEILTKHKITHILNITAHLPLHWEGEDILYRRLPASDSGCQNLKQYFADAIQFIGKKYKQTKSEFMFFYTIFFQGLPGLV